MAYPAQALDAAHAPREPGQPPAADAVGFLLATAAA
jgi:hypothetical protein